MARAVLAASAAPLAAALAAGFCGARFADPPRRAAAVGLGAGAAAGVAVAVFPVPAEGAAAGAVVAAALAASAAVDLRKAILPNALTLPLLLCGLAAGALGLGAAAMDRAAGAVLGWGVVAAVDLAFRRLRRRSVIGGGDAKLLAAGGAWCGAAALPGILLLAAPAAAAASLVAAAAGRHGPQPFGPWLATAIWIAMTLGRPGLP